MPVARLVRHVKQQVRGPWLAPLLRFYPPYLGAGVRVRALGPLGFEAEMPLTWWNRNYFGTHFGGSLYAMCDPFFALILTRQLGREFEVWDKSATIRFRRPGRSTVRARFEVAPERVAEVRARAIAEGKVEEQFQAVAVDAAGVVVAELDKRVHVRWRGAR
jgi:hypothetical protein